MNMNNFLHWRSDYSIGIPIIDKQHKEIMVLINDLLKICKEDNGKDHEPFRRLVLRIIEHFQQHFSDEEELMLEINYPHYEKHKKRHNCLLEDVKKMLEKIIDEKQKPSLVNVVIFLREWFVENIYGEDKQMGEYYNEQFRIEEWDMEGQTQIVLDLHNKVFNPELHKQTRTEEKTKMIV